VVQSVWEKLTERSEEIRKGQVIKRKIILEIIAEYRRFSTMS